MSASVETGDVVVSRRRFSTASFGGWCFAVPLVRLRLLFPSCPNSDHDTGTTVSRVPISPSVTTPYSRLPCNGRERERERERERFVGCFHTGNTHAHFAQNLRLLTQLTQYSNYTLRLIESRCIIHPKATHERPQPCTSRKGPQVTTPLPYLEIFWILFV